MNKRAIMLLLLGLVPGIFSAVACWSFSGNVNSISPSNWFNGKDDILFHLTFKKASVKKLVMNSQENGAWGAEVEKDLPFDGEVTVYIRHSDIPVPSFKIQITDQISSNQEDYFFEDRIIYALETVDGAASGKVIECKKTSGPCWSFGGVVNSISPSNWLNEKADIMFHLTFKKASEKKLVMNSQENGEWGTEVEKNLPFNGEITIDVSHTEIPVPGFTIQITNQVSGKKGQKKTYFFADRIIYALETVDGAASGKEVECGHTTKPPSSKPPTSGPVGCPPSKPFFEEFSSGSLDNSKWLVAHTSWGSKPGVYQNGGVVYDNVKVKNDRVIFKTHGSLYDGPVKGVDKIGDKITRREDGVRTGGAIATRDYFGAGKYEVRMKASPELGACSAFWTFYYNDDDHYGGTIPRPDILNHEIDIELPGRPGPGAVNIDFDHALLNTFITEKDYTAGYTRLPVRTDDGKFHTWRFDWHTDPDDRRVVFYLDEKWVRTSTSDMHIPSYAGRIWMGTWFPNAWAGDPDFGVSQMEVDWVKFTPFDEAFECPPESYPEFGWAPGTNFSPTSSPTRGPATKSPTTKPPANPCVGLPKSQCRKKEEQCVYSTKKKEMKKTCFTKNEKFDHECSQYATRKLCVATDYCYYTKAAGCNHKCETTNRSTCREAERKTKKICKFAKKPNPCFKICCAIS